MFTSVIELFVADGDGGLGQTRQLTYLRTRQRRSVGQWVAGYRAGALTA